MFHTLSWWGLDQNLASGYEAEAKGDRASFVETASLVLLRLRRSSPVAAQLYSVPCSWTAKLFHIMAVSCQTQISKQVESRWDVCVTNFSSLSLQLFEGNIHYDIPEIRRFDPVPAQYVRVHPERWSPAGIGMRLEVLGCDWTGRTPVPPPTGCERD